MGTIRRFWDFSDPKKPKLFKNVENINRTDLKVGGKWIPSVDSYNATLQDRQKYFKNNQSPGLEPPKKDNQNKPKEKKKNGQ